MPVSEVFICNLALRRIRISTPIETLDEDSAEARVCKEVYEHCRNVLLMRAWWPFAKRRATLSLLTDAERTNWEYAYALPADCLEVRYVEPGARVTTNSTRTPFELETNEAGTATLLSTDQEDAEIVYTAKITNPQKFHPLFVDALGWLIAKEIVIPLVKSAELEDRAFKMYEGAASRAVATAMREKFDLEPRSELLASRG